MARDIENGRRLRREHYVRYREKYIAKAYERTQVVKSEIRQWIGDYLSIRCCVDCGEGDIVVLDFDHRDDCVKSFNIGGAISLSVSLKKIKLEVEKCDIRCANCHKRKTSIQFGWWRNTFVLSDSAQRENTNTLENLSENIDAKKIPVRVRAPQKRAYRARNS